MGTRKSKTIKYTGYMRLVSCEKNFWRNTGPFFQPDIFQETPRIVRGKNILKNSIQAKDTQTIKN